MARVHAFLFARECVPVAEPAKVICTLNRAPEAAKSDPTKGDTKNTKFVYRAIFSVFHYSLPCSRLVVSSIYKFRITKRRANNRENG